MVKHFGCGPNNDVLLGDLAEQYRQRQNALWYWRQATKAIPVSLFQEVRKHKRPAAIGIDDRRQCRVTDDRQAGLP